MEQGHDVPWARHFLASHLQPEAARQKAERYLADRMVSPPPLVLRAPGSWYVLERSPRPGEFSGAWEHARAAGALGHWLHWVRARRDGTVAAGRSVARLARDILDEAPKQGGDMRLGLAAL